MSVKPGKKRRSLCNRWMGRFFLVFVPYMILYVGWSSIYLLLGTACPGTLAPSTCTHLALALFFEFQILWNYFAAALMSPGSPEDGEDCKADALPENERFKGFSLCRRCCLPRPIGCNHCSTCEKCVLDLDHHCVFIHNCVGYANRKTFFLFCMYALAGCIYPIIVMIYTGYYFPDALSRMVYPKCITQDISDIWQQLAGRRPYAGDDPVLGFMPVGTYAECRKNTVIISLLMFKVTAVILGVGVLWSRQVCLLAHDTTMLQEAASPRLVGENPLEVLALAYANMRRTLGPVSSWILPSLGPLPPAQGGRPVPAKIQELWSAFSSEGGSAGKKDK